MVSFFYWHMVVAPLWIVTVSWNIQRLLVRWFSVPTMLRTLFAHWHKDVVPYLGKSLSGVTLAFALNIISRAVGFIVRVTLLVVWGAVASVTGFLSAATLVAFVVWPIVLAVAWLQVAHNFFQ